MNDLNYDVAIPGNHEFDYGMERFLELTRKAIFPYISCNFNREGELVFAPYIIKEIDGVKLAFVGVTTPETIISSTPRFFQDEEGNYIYGFMPGDDGAELYGAVQKAVDDARGDGADYVILLAHLGNQSENKPYTYADVIEHTNGIDAVLDGHSHDNDKVTMKNKDGKDVVRQASGTKLNGIGWLHICAADGSIDSGLYTWNNKSSAPDLLGIRNDLSSPVDEARSSIEDKLSQVIGTSSVNLTIFDPYALDEDSDPIRIVRRAETNLGDLITDAFRIQSGADVAIICGGAFRKSISKGEITIKDIIGAFPFGNRVYMAEVTGQQILNALEWGVQSVPEENGAFLQVSGMSFEIHTYIESSCMADENGLFAGVNGEYRVKNVMIGDKPLVLDRVYTLTSQDYTLLNHGVGNTAFDRAKTIWHADVPDYGVAADYIREKLGGVVGDGYENPYGQGRIVAVDAP